jgi:Ni/Fe-hydrogenase subunit HybB-like protein
VLGLLLVPRTETWLFLLEIALCLVIPLVMLLIPRVRNSESGLYFAAVTTLLGFVANRLNVSLTGMEAASGVHYFPKFTEVAVTASIVAVGFAIFAVATRYLPIFESAADIVARERSAAARRPSTVRSTPGNVENQPGNELVAP